MANLVFGNSSATFFRAVSWLKPTATIGREAVAGEAAQRLLALGVVLGLEIAVFGAGVLLELLGARMDAFVEGLVELAAEIVDDRGLEGGLLREGGGGGEGEAREREAELGDCHRQWFPVMARACDPVASDDGTGRAKTPSTPVKHAATIFPLGGMVDSPRRCG